MAQEETTLYEGDKFNIVLKTVEGRSGAHMARPVIRHPGAVVIIPETDDGGLVLIRNFRFAVDEWLIEVPAGTMNSGEDPEGAAHRELEEETGYCATELQLLASYYAAPAFCDEVMHVYGARGLSPGEFKPEDDERIEVIVASPSTIETWLKEGKIKDSKTILAIHYWREWMKQRTPI